MRYPAPLFTLLVLPALALAAEPPLELRKEASAFAARLESARQSPAYSEHASLDLDGELAALERKAAAFPELSRTLTALRGRVVPDFHKPKAIEDPLLLNELRWSDFARMKNAALSRPDLAAFAKVRFADEGDFVSREGARRLTTPELLELWRQFKALPAEAAAAAEPERAQPPADLRAMRADLDRIAAAIKEGGVQSPDGAAALARLYDRMSRADLAALAGQDPEAFGSVMTRMSSLREQVPARSEGWLHAGGAVERFDRKWASQNAQLLALMKDVRAPPEWTGVGEPAGKESWWARFTAEGSVRAQRGELLRIQSESAAAILKADPSSGAQTLLARLNAFPDPFARESWLLSAKTFIDESPKGRQVRILADLAGVEGGAEALEAFKKANGPFLEAYSKFGSQSAEYKLWLRDNVHALPEGTKLDARVLNIDPGMLPGHDPEAPLSKSSRMVGGQELPGLAYPVKDGKSTRFFTSLPVAGAGVLPANLVYDARGILKERQLYLPGSGPEAKTEVISEQGTFDAQGRLVKGVVYQGAVFDPKAPLETVETAILPNGDTQRTRRRAQAEGQRPHQRVVEVLSADGKLKLSRTSQLDAATGREVSRSDASFDASGKVDQVERAVLDRETGTKVLFKEVWHQKDGRWLKYLKNEEDQTEQGLAAGETAWGDLDPAHPERGQGPVLKGPAAFRVQTAQGEVTGMRLDLSALRALSPEERRAKLMAFAQGPLAEELFKYQPRTIAVGFHGGSDAARNPGALVGLLEQVEKDAAQQGLTPAVILDMESGEYKISLLDPSGAPRRRFIAQWHYLSVDNKDPDGLSVYAVAPDGTKGSILVEHIAGADKKYLPHYVIKNDNYIFGTDWGSGANSLLGARQHEREDFKAFTREGPGDGTWKEGPRIRGQWKQTYEGPTAFKTTWDSTAKAGESVVALGGVVVSGVGYGLAAAADAVTDPVTSALGAYSALTGDPAGVAAYNRSAADNQGFLKSMKEDMAKRVLANATMNPLVGAYRSEDSLRRQRAAESEYYIMEAPTVMAKQAVASDSAAGKIFWGGLSAATNFGLQTGVGLASFGPMGGIGAAKNSWTVTKAFHAGFSYSMTGLGVYGAAESAFGQDGIIDSAHKLAAKPTPENELAFYQSLNNFSANTMPFVVGAAMSGKKGAKAPSEEPSPKPAEKAVPRPVEPPGAGPKAAPRPPPPVEPPAKLPAGLKLETKALESQYEGENIKGKNRWHCGPTDVQYLSAAERGRYRLTVKDGKLYDAGGKPFDTSKAFSAHSGDGVAIFVMDAQGNIFAATEHHVGKFHHSSFLGGEPVAFAGEMLVTDGVLSFVSRRSGHYRPPAGLKTQLFDVLSFNGIDMSGVKYGDMSPPPPKFVPPPKKPPIFGSH